MNERPNLPWIDQFAQIAPEWVEAEASASLLEDMKTATLAQHMTALGDMPVSRAEMQVKASPEWTDYITNMVEARKKANLLKLRLEYVRMQHMKQQADDATRRTEMRLV